ncbi:FAD binding domain-containing protein [Streptomyces sp. NPDC090493]|uniref:FAD binding domain-containing protein n=1 Tax=Streptomyces sp. NPDC090493 TaxID=3365964 RepID=UPI00381A25AB
MRSQEFGAGLIAQNQSSLAPFRLRRPTSVDEAVALVAAEPETVIAAGCTDLVAQLREGRAPRAMVHLGRVPELREIAHRGDRLSLGPTATLYQIATAQAVAGAVPGLARACARIATVRVRRTATLGGNLLARRFRYEMPVLLGALDAELEFAGGPGTTVEGLWREDAEEGRACGAWEPQGLLTGVSVRTAGLVWFGYERSMRPTATVALAVRRRADGTLTVRAVAGSEYRRPYTMTCRTGVAALAEAEPAQVGGALAAQLPDRIADYCGSAEYRRHLFGVLTARLLTAASEATTPGVQDT